MNEDSDIWTALPDLDALRAAHLAAPGDRTLAFVYADCLAETDPRAACLVRIAADPECDEWRHQYAATLPPDDPTAEFIRLSCTGSKALPVKAGAWLMPPPWSRSSPVPGAAQANWPRLVPALAEWAVRNKALGCSIRVERSGRWIELHATGLRWQGAWFDGQSLRDVCEIEFTRGFVKRVVFRDWRFADIILPLLLADQPFVEPELTAACRMEEAANGDPVARVTRARMGPAFDLIDRDDWGRILTGIGYWYEFDAEDRARRAVGKALLARAALIRTGTARAGVDVAANAEAVAAEGAG